MTTCNEFCLFQVPGEVKENKNQEQIYVQKKNKLEAYKDHVDDLSDRDEDRKHFRSA